MISFVVVAQLTIGAQVTPIMTRANVPGDSSLTELRLVAPVIFASWSGLDGRLMAHAMINGEGWTMRNGELATGDWGEGFDDRRHPHTWMHELLLTATDLAPLPGALHWSITAGKGFAPFGTDDPMNRPALIYPVNHHWAQVLERAILIVGLQRGPFTIEGGLFNGDEPERFSQWPNLSRFGDSWSARAFYRPDPSLEVQVSHANVKSPEHRAGAGLEHVKTSVSARLERRLAGGEFQGLAEWAYNSEGAGFFKYYSELAEGQWSRGRVRTYARLEHTDRPEEERIFGDPFRSTRPHSENGNIGITRWWIVTAGAAFSVSNRELPFRMELIAEAGFDHVSALTGVFDPLSWYGRNDLVSLSVALRIAAGTTMHRMGRYGVAAASDHHDGYHVMEK